VIRLCTVGTDGELVRALSTEVRPTTDLLLLDSERVTGNTKVGPKSPGLSGQSGTDPVGEAKPGEKSDSATTAAAPSGEGSGVSLAAATVVPLVADVTKASDCEIVAAAKRFGRLDILVNNAGRGMEYVSDAFMTKPARFWEISSETWRLIVTRT
jgi:hypothetical protein